METSAAGINAIAALVDATAWPSAAAFGLWVLRREIAQLVGRVENVSFAGSSIGLSRREAVADIAEAGEQLAEAGAPAPSQGTAPLIDRTMQDLIASDPRQAILLSWNTVQNALVELGNRHDVWLDLRSMRSTTDTLIEHGIISGELADAIKKLHSTCKWARRVNHFDLRRSEIEEYVIFSQQARATLDSL